MFRILKNKKAMERTTIEFLVGIAIVAVAAILIILLYKQWGESAGREAEKAIEVPGDADNDGIANAFDRCCPKACSPLGQAVDTDMNSDWYGCTELQGITLDCKATECNWDYDHDGVLNEVDGKQLDQCCAPQCKTDDEVNKVDCQKKDPIGSRCGCAKNQNHVVGCDAPPDQVCESPEIVP